MKTIFKVLLALAVVVMGYLCYEAIAIPVNFEKIQTQREEEIAKKLKEIASYELAYKTVNGTFAEADELVRFLESGNLYYVKAEGDYTDAMREKGISEQEAAAKGLIRRDTVLISAKDSLMKGTNYETVSDVLRVPGFSDHKVEINTAIVEQYLGNDTIRVSVFEAMVPMELYLGDLDAQQRSERIDAAKKLNSGKGYPGMKIGSLEELKLTGNWE